MTKRIKVLQLQAKYNVRASDLHEEIIKALPPQQYEVTAAYLRGRPGPGDLQSISESAKYFDMTKNSLSGLRLAALWKLWRYCRQEKFDVVITHLFKPLHMMLFLNRFLKIPRCIGVLHAFGNFERAYRRRFMRRHLDSRWHFVSVSQPLKQHLIDCHCGFENGNVSTIHNALDCAQTRAGLLSRQQARKTLGLDPDALVFGTIGRLVPVKGHAHLITAFRSLLHTVPQARLVIIGGGRLQEKLTEQIQHAGLTETVSLAGEINAAYRFIPAFDVFVLPSLSEGMPLVLLEAMIAKTPIIASRVGGISDMLIDPEAFTAPADPPDLLRAMEKYARLTPHQRQILGEQLYLRVKQEFNIEAFHSQYRRLIGGQL